LRLSNPTDTQATYYFAFQGLNSAYFTQANLPYSVNVPAHSTVDVPVQVASPVVGADGFTVEAFDYVTTAQGNTIKGADQIVQATLNVAGTPKVIADTKAYGVVATLTPAQATAGLGTSANYVIQLTNTGSAEETLYPQINNLPNGVYYQFQNPSQAGGVTVAPGASNFVDVPITLISTSGQTPGQFPFSVTYTGYTDQNTPYSSTANGTLNVVSSGVAVNLYSTTGYTSGPPGTTFDMTVTNYGTATDTFDLSLGGPAAAVSSLATNKITLAPGYSQTVQITTGAVNFADSGSLELDAIATSETNSAVTSSDKVNLVIPTTMGVSSKLSPSTEILPVPGTTSFLLIVNNTGNLEDSYTATITGTNGPVTASLVGLDGNPTQTVPIFILPGLSTGEILLQTDLTSTGSGAVTVQVTSLTNDALTTSSTATVNTPKTNSAPTVVVTDNGGTYNGNSFPATGTVAGKNGVAGTTLEGVGLTFTYYTGSSITGTPLTGAPSAAGTYTVVAAFAGSEDYSSASASKIYTITKATPTVSVSATGGIYNGNAFVATATVTGVSGSPTSSLDGVSPTITYYLNGVASTTPPTQAGFYYAVAVFNGSTNYAYNYAETTFTIAKATPKITVSDAGGTYNGNSFVATTTLTGVGGSPTASLDGVSLSVIYYLNGVASATPPTQAGFYFVAAVFNGSTNYGSTYVQSTFTIAKATPTITVSDAGGTYNGNPFPATTTLIGISGKSTSSLDGVSLTVTYYLNGVASTTPPTQAGFYWAVAEFAGSTNYAYGYTHTTFTIAQAMPKITISDAGGTYNGNPFAATTTLTGVSGKSTSSLDGVSLTVTYYLNGVASTTPPTQAGFYWAVAEFAGSTNYAYEYTHTTFTIAQAMPKITITDAGGTYNGKPFAATTTLTGIGGSPTSSLDGVSLTVIYYLNGVASMTPPTKAGFYYAAAVFTGSTNYSATYVQTTFTIAKAVPTISVSDAGGTYNGNSFAATTTLTGVSGSPTSSLDGVPLTVTYYLNGVASTTPPTSAGYYWVVAMFPGSNNYAFEYTHTTFAIAQATPTLSITDASGAYNGNGFAATATATGVKGSPSSSLEGVALQVMYYQNGQEFDAAPSHAGTYWAVVVFDGSTDYLATYTHTVFTITPAAVTLTIGNDSQIIGIPANLSQDLGTTIITGIAGQNFGISYTSPGDTANAALGQYPINGNLSSDTGLLSDYQVTLNPGKLTVNPPSKTFVVTSALDTPQAGLLTLRQAIAESNSDTTVDKITFALTYPTTIVLSCEIDITHSVNIVGPGANELTVSGNGACRIFDINAGSGSANAALDVSICGLTLANGWTIGTTTGTGVGADYSGEGGAIFNQGQLTLCQDAISGNKASAYGGGVFNGGSVVSSGIVYENNASSFGGAVDNDTGAIFVSTNDTYWGNTAYFGGAIKNLGLLTTTDDTITANNALTYGGGLFVDGTWNSLNTVVAGNLLNTVGKSEVYVDQGSTTDAWTVNAHNTLIGDANTAGGIQNGVNGNIVGQSTSSIFVTDSSGKPLLANNGGPTPTVALATNSPAWGTGGSLATVSSLTATATTFTVSDATYLTVGDLLQIGTEVVKLTGITGNSSSGYTVTIQRNQGGTSFSTTTATPITLATDERGIARKSNDLGAY
jgi:hypothetical protein